MLANLLWVLLSLPIVTLPAATAGLFAVMSGYARGTRRETFNTFFGAMRQYWLGSSAIVILDLVVGILLYINFTIFQLMDMSNPVALLSRSVTLFAGALLALVNVYVWPLLVLGLFNTPRELPALFKAAIKLVMAHPFWSVGIVIAAIFPLMLSAILPMAALILFVAALIVYIINWGAWHVIQIHLSPDELRQIDININQ